MSQWLPVISLLTAMLLWASSFIVLKIAFVAYDPMVVIFGRMLVASVCFLLVWQRKRWRYEYQPGDWRLLLLMVVSEPCLYFVFEALALQNTSAAQAGMITALAPLLVGVGAFYFLKERLSLMVWLGFTLAVVGVVWLTLAGEAAEYAPNPLLGNFLEFCAMICATGYVLALKKLSLRYSPWLLTALQAVSGMLFFLPALALPATELPTAWKWDGVLAVLYLGTFVNIAAYGLYNLAVSKIKAAQASAFINLIPVFTLIMAYLFLGEMLNAQQLCACVLVLGGVFLSQWRPRRRTSTVA